MLLHSTEFHPWFSLSDSKRRHHLNYFFIFLYLPENSANSTQGTRLFNSIDWTDNSWCGQFCDKHSINRAKIVNLNRLRTYIGCTLWKWVKLCILITSNDQISSKTTSNNRHGGHLWDTHIFICHSCSKFYPM